MELAKIGERKITPEELLAMPEPAGEDAAAGLIHTNCMALPRRL